MINTAIKEDLENPQPYNPGKGKELEDQAFQ